MLRVVFQPTHPHGVRRVKRAWNVELYRGFNPRTRTGCDDCSSQRQRAPNCFNPRTRTGCDSYDERYAGWERIVSTHAPARGATGVMLDLCIRCLSFNPRTRTGCDGVGGR